MFKKIRNKDGSVTVEGTKSFIVTTTTPIEKMIENTWIAYMSTKTMRPIYAAVSLSYNVQHHSYKILRDHCEFEFKEYMNPITNVEKTLKID